MRKLIVAFIAIIVLTGCTPTNQGQVQLQDTSNINEDTMDNSAKVEMYDAEPPVLEADELANKTAIIKTEKGDITVELYGEAAPATVSNFIFLAAEDFYNGLTFHRREPGFVIQGGDPAGNGTGGPGYTLPAEIGEEHIKGALAMARLSDAVNPQKRSSGSQFYITLEATPFLDGEYTVFGKVTKGMDVVDNIEIGDKILEVVIK